MKYMFLFVFLFGCYASKNEVVKTYYPNGNIYAITEMKNGKKNGEEQLFFENGNLFMRQFFKEDMFVDSIYKYQRDIPNKLVCKGYVVMKSKVVLLDTNGQNIVGESDFVEKAVGDGLTKLYYKGGQQVLSLSEYKNNKDNGIQVEYYRNGNIKRIEHHRDGVLVPPILDFDTSGHVLKNERVN